MVQTPIGGCLLYSLSFCLRHLTPEALGHILCIILDKKFNLEEPKRSIVYGKMNPKFPRKDYKVGFHLFMRGIKMNNEEFHKSNISWNCKSPKDLNENVLSPVRTYLLQVIQITQTRFRILCYFIKQLHF